MPARPRRDVRQYGDFQTPPDLAASVCGTLMRLGVDPAAVLEPTCGRGAFLAAANVFPSVRTLVGVEINPAYVAEACRYPRAQVEQGDFFNFDWNSLFARDHGPWLILGNPPWVTNAELGALESNNLPLKSNFKGYQGLDAITGKANFDISEWMLLQQLSWLKVRKGWIATLVKTSVARKLLRHAWKRGEPVGQASIFQIDAMRHFSAAVDACLFVLPVNQGTPSQNCAVYLSLQASQPTTVIGFHDEMIVADVPIYQRWRHLMGANGSYVWRSGIKHDCAKVMELRRSPQGLRNGDDEAVEIEDACLFPMAKSSDVARGDASPDRFMIVTQRYVGENTSLIRTTAPRTWNYLLNHAQILDRRASVIYRNKPRFCMFGVGDYAFASWKVAISAFYKDFAFRAYGPVHGKPVVFDDTVYFLSCQTEDEARFLLSLVSSEPYQRLLRASTFADEKRAVTADLLNRISLQRTAEELGVAETYRHFTSALKPAQLDLAIAP